MVNILPPVGASEHMTNARIAAMPWRLRFRFALVLAALGRAGVRSAMLRMATTARAVLASSGTALGDAAVGAPGDVDAPLPFTPVMAE